MSIEIISASLLIWGFLLMQLIGPSGTSAPQDGDWLELIDTKMVTPYNNFKLCDSTYMTNDNRVEILAFNFQKYSLKLMPKQPSSTYLDGYYTEESVDASENYQRKYDSSRYKGYSYLANSTLTIYVVISKNVTTSKCYVSKIVTSTLTEDSKSRSEFPANPHTLFSYLKLGEKKRTIYDALNNPTQVIDPFYTVGSNHEAKHNGGGLLTATKKTFENLGNASSSGPHRIKTNWNDTDFYRSMKDPGYDITEFVYDWETIFKGNVLHESRVNFRLAGMPTLARVLDDSRFHTSYFPGVPWAQNSDLIAYAKYTPDRKSDHHLGLVVYVRELKQLLLAGEKLIFEHRSFRTRKICLL